MTGASPVPGSPAAEELDRFLRENEDHIIVVARDANVWDVLVPSYWKETVSVSLHITETHLRGDAFFLRAPDERAADAYRLLLRRNERAHVWKFSVNDVGDVSVTCELPVAAIDANELDRLFGRLISLVDETYEPYMRIAFGSALEEQVRRGGPGLGRPPWVFEGPDTDTPSENR